MSAGLTMESLLKSMDILYPPLYYAMSESVELGRVIFVPRGIFHPEFIVFHPDNLDRSKMLAQEIGRRLVPLNAIGESS